MAGGWYPVLVGCLVFTVVTTWQRGRQLLKRQLDAVREPAESFFASARTAEATRLPGTAVFLTRPSKTIPPTLLHHLEHHHVLHEQVILLGIEQVDQPRVAARDRVEVETLPAGFYRLTIRYGYLQGVNVPTALRLAEHAGLTVDTSQVTYYIGRETLIPIEEVGDMALWRERLFAFLSRNALRTAVYYGIPVEQVVELGIEIEI